MKKLLNRILFNLIVGLIIFGLVWFFQYGQKYNPFATKPAAQEQQQEQEFEQDKLIGTTLADNVLVTNAQGEKVSLLSLLDKEKLTFVTVWATWCESCSEQYPLLEEVAKDKAYADKFNFIMINMTAEESGLDKRIEIAKEYVEKNGYELPVYFDETGSTIEAFLLEVIPTGILLSPQGELLDGLRGAAEDLQELKLFLDTWYANYSAQ